MVKGMLTTWRDCGSPHFVRAFIRIEEVWSVRQSNMNDWVTRQGWIKLLERKGSDRGSYWAEKKKQRPDGRVVASWFLIERNVDGDLTNTDKRNVT